MPIYLSLGSIFFLIVALLRDDTDKWAIASYWIGMMICGVLLLIDPLFSAVFIFIQFPLMRLLIRYLFHQPASLKTVALAITLGVISGLLLREFRWFSWCFPAYLIIESVYTWRFVSRLFTEKGINLVSHPGARVIQLTYFLGLNIVFAVLLVLDLHVDFKITWLLPWAYLLVSFYGTWIFLGKRGSSPLLEIPKYQKSTLSAQTRYAILNAIEKEFNNPDFYTDHQASVSKLSKLTGFNSHQLSQVINESRGMSFSELLTFARIRRAKKILQDPSYDHLKMEGIAEEVGYLSKSTFNTSFKRITGKTPSEWKEREVRNPNIQRRNARESQQADDFISTFKYTNAGIIMYSNYFKVYLRNVLKNKTFSFINFSGLMVGMVSVLLIGIYLQHEYSYDRFHDSAEDIYRIELHSNNSQTRTWHPMPLALVRDFPQVISGVSISPIYGPGLTLQSIYTRNPEDNIMFKEANAFFVDTTFFNVFDFKLIAGNEEVALKELGGVIITKSLANKYFKDEDPLGKALEFPQYEFTAVVTGIMEDPPVNSHFHPAILVSYVTRKSVSPDSPWFTWDDPGHHNYIRLSEGADPRQMEHAMIDWLPKYLDLSENDIQGMLDRTDYLAFTRLTDIHLHSDIRWELEQNSNITYIYILGAAIAFLLIISSINFVNLSTARAIERAKEVGIRKTLGAHRRGILFEFIFESITTCLIAMILAFLLAFIIFDSFTEIAGKPLGIQDLFSTTVIFSTIAVALLIGIISGIYPSLILSRIKASEMVKGKFGKGPRGSFMQKMLIMVQFGVAAVMLTGSLIVLMQIRYMEQKSLGFDDDQVLVLDLDNDERSSLSAFKNELLSLPGITAVSGISNLPASQFNQNVIFNDQTLEEPINCSELQTDFDALQLLGVQLKEGRWFDQSQQMDSIGRSFIINEAAASRLLSENVIGESVTWNAEGGPIEGNIIGVVEDFHFKSLHQSIQPMVVQVSFNSLNYLLIKVKGGEFQKTLAKIDEIHSSFDQTFELDYYFLDDSVDRQYDSERNAFAIFNIFSVIALALSTIGLIGLSYLIVTQRTREIGIRKVFGARILDIIWLENRPFILVMILSLLIGLPTSFYIMQDWLDNFAYRTALGPTPFLLSAGVITAVALISVTISVLSTAVKSPSSSLRYE